jgi:23S rRNA pseudouridine1911/1915/1917 synthase
MPPPETPDRSFTVPPELHNRKLDGALRELLGSPWSEARKLIETGKISVKGEVITSLVRRVRAGDVIELRERAPRPRTVRIQEIEGDLIVYVDANVVVVRKPAGVSTVPFGDESRSEREETLDALVRDVVAKRDRIRGRAPLGVVHRLDKATSGLLVFARTVAAKKHLAAQFRVHSVERRYLAIAHGAVSKRSFRSYLVADRGDGLRGTTDLGEHHRGGQLAITHVEPVEALRGATLVSCRLETGRTHQIRIHLAEAGHPIVGESVYVRRYAGPRIPAPRLMLHATELGFEHPESGRPMHFTEPPPADFQQRLAELRA